MNRSIVSALPFLVSCSVVSTPSAVDARDPVVHVEYTVVDPTCERCPPIESVSLASLAGRSASLGGDRGSVRQLARLRGGEVELSLSLNLRDLPSLETEVSLPPDEAVRVARVPKGDEGREGGSGHVSYVVRATVLEGAR